MVETSIETSDVRRQQRGLLLFVVFVLILAVAVPALAKHRPVTGTVTAENLTFDSPVTIQEGTNLLFVNLDLVHHTVSSPEFLFESGAVVDGERIVNTERLAPGEYQFFCGFHPSMTGTLVVED